jgi:hypothetical protein
LRRPAAHAPRPIPEADVKDLPDLDHLANLPSVYLAADYKWELDGDWRPLRIGERATELEAAFPDARSFGLISGANPAHILRPDPENRSADRALEQAIVALGLRYRPAFVAALGRSWKAYNWLLIDPPTDHFDALARRFGQIGTLLWAHGEPVRLRMRARRPETVSAHPFIDWTDAAGGTLPAPAAEAIPPDAT